MDKYIKYEDIRECRFFQDERGEWILHADIINLPAEDVAPVRYGRWILSMDELTASCSECGTSFPCWRMWPANFCPNCGANMRDNTQKTSVDEEVKHG